MRRLLRGTLAVVVTVGTIALPALPASAGTSREVAVDLRPGSADGSVNLRGSAMLPVAILTTSTFDARDVAPVTVCFGDAENATQRDCTEAHGTGHLEDVDGDGDTDLLLHYDAEDAGLDAGDTRACLEGETLAGTPIHGCDGVTVKNGAPEAYLPDLTTTVVANPTSTGPGDVVTWTASLTNEGTGAITFAPGTRVLRLLVPTSLGSPAPAAPAGFTCTVATATAFDCVNDDPYTLVPGAAVAFPISGAMPSLPGPVTVSATADPGQVVAESDETDNTRDATAVVDPANLTATLVAAPAALAPGEPTTLTAVVTNAGSVAAHVPAGTVLVRFGVPSGFTTGAITGPAGYTCSGLSCAATAATTLPVGAALTFTLAAAAPSAVAPYTLSAKADPDDALTEADEADNNATANVLVEPANLVTTVSSLTGPVGSGSAVEWTAELVNLGPGKVRLPAGTRAISFTLSQPLANVSVTGPSGYTCAAVTTTEYACSTTALTTLLAGDRATFTVTATAPSDGSFSLTTTADPGNAVAEADETDNSASSAATVSVGNLTITAAPTANPVDATATSTWNVTVTNTGGPLNLASGTHLLRFTWPTGVTNLAVSTPAGYSCFIVEANTADCAATAATTIAAGATVPITVFATTPRTPGPLTLTFSVDPLAVVAESNEADNVTTATTVVQPPDLSTTLTATPNPGEAGFSTTWVARITNDGPSNARISTGMTLVRFAVPSGMSNLAVSTPSGYTCFLSATLVVDCTTTATQNIAAGAHVEITFFGTAPREPGSVSLTATADPLEVVPEGDETDNAATTTITTRGPDFVTTLTATPTPQLTNATGTWVARVTNNGPGRARLATGSTFIRFSLPTGLANLAVSTPSGLTCFLAETLVVDCTLTASRTIAVDEVLEITLFATPRVIGTIALTATADPAGAVPEEDDTNNAATTEAVVRGPNLTIGMAATPDPALTNTTTTWVATITNAGLAPARLVSGSTLVRLEVPTTLSNLAVSTPSGFTCFLASTGVVECTTTTTQTLAAGSSWAITLFGSPRALADLAVTATADPGAVVLEEDETDNAVTTTTPVRGANLTTRLTATPDPVDLSHTSTWVARVTNEGPAPARITTGTALVRFEVPTSFGNLAVSTPAGVTCFLASTGVVECETTATQTLAAGAFHDITLFATPRQPGTVTVTATADPANLVLEENDGDNAATASIVVRPPDYAMSVTPAAVSAAPGEATTWTVTLVNNGPAAARTPTATKFGVSFPADLGAPAITGPSGWACSISTPGYAECNSTTTQTIAVGGTVVFTLTGAAPPAAGTLVVGATADVTSLVPEANELNNDATGSMAIG